MTKTQATELLEAFSADTDYQQFLAQTLNAVFRLCAANALARGFHDDENLVLVSLLDADGKPTPEHDWTTAQLLQAELGRQASEIGEAIEAVRKPGPDPHCPGHDAFHIEQADCIIRIGDTCGKRGIDLGGAIIAKMLYNMGRPYKHGKNS